MLCSIVAAIIFSAAVFIFYENFCKKHVPHAKIKVCMIAVIVSALLIRLIAAFIYPGHASDMNCFDVWSDMAYTDGFKSFYTSSVFTDYPPGYVYILYLLGFVKSILNISSYAAYPLLKLPAILCDVLCAAVVYKTAKTRANSALSLMFASFFLFNPAVIVNSAVWGQVDSVFTFFVLLMLLSLHKKRMIPSYFFFAIAVFTKPQALFYVPVLLFGILENVFFHGFFNKNFIKNLAGGLSAVLLIIILSLPFGLSEVIRQYTATIGSYDYITVNAYNLWCAFGFNWSALSPATEIFGYLYIIAAVSASAVIFFKSKSENRYFYTAAFLCFCVFMLSVKMHERYAYPAIALILCAFSLSAKRSELLLFSGISFVQLLNTVHVLFYYDADSFFTSSYELTSRIISLLAVLLFVVFVIYTKKEYIGKSVKKHLKETQISSCVSFSFTKKDAVLLSLITAVYATIALFNLGNISSPQKGVTLEPNHPITIDIKDETDISEIKLFLGPRELSEERTLTLLLTDAIGNVTHSEYLTSGDVFFWNEIKDISANTRCLTLTASDTLYILEAGIYDSYSKLVTPDTSSPLFDEQNTVPKFENYRNSTYFDEIYHARTAYEFLYKLPVYEWTHPPLGKIFISLGVRTFGMTPFGWRICGTLFGILMVPIIYIFSKRMFGKTYLAACSAILLSADFMHFAQTRIATIDVYVTFFIMLMYLFMYKYVCMDFKNTPLKKIFVPLLFCGLSMGLGIACKWTGAYAGAGLAVIFFLKLLSDFNERSANFPQKAAQTLAFCVLSFVVLPVLIYLLSYLPFAACENTGFGGIIQNQIDMFTYHGKTVVSATHSFSSPWYLWPIDFRPIWYYSGVKGGLSENISSFGNPLIWWCGIPAFFYCAYDALFNKNKNAIFLTISFLAQLVPWIPVTRTTFIYHYFPCVPFIVLLLTHTAAAFLQKNSKYKVPITAFTLLAVLLFILFYPVISGFPVNEAFVKGFLRWLPSWQLIG